MTDFEINEAAFAPLEHLHAGVLVFDCQYRVLFCNQRLADWAKVDTAVVVGNDVTDWVPKLNDMPLRSAVAESFSQMEPLSLDSQTHHYLVLCPLADGRVRTHDALLSPYVLHGNVVMQVSLYDCTDQIAHIDALEEANVDLRRVARMRRESDRQNALLASALDAAAEAVVVVDYHGHVQYANRSFFAMSRVEAPSIRNKPLLELLTLDQEDDEDLVAHVRSVLSDGNPWRGRLVVCRRDGVRFPASVSTAPLAGKRGQAVIVLDDISEYERANHARKVREKHAAMMTLVGGIAHDFNNLLSGMVGNLYLMRRSCMVDDAKGMRRLTAIESSVQEASQIVSDLLIYARGDDVSQGVFALFPFVKEWCKGVKESLGDSGHLELNLHPCQAFIRADVGALQIVLDVLASNAMDAVADVDAPLLRITFALEEELPDGLSSDIHYFCLSLSDNGMGIDTKNMALIFDPFFSTRKLGSGLGLSTAKSSIERIGGMLDIRSQEGGGTCAKIWLPLVKG
ncbi:MAG: PAS domain-containing protein [Mariprofundales bacterium]